MAVFLKRSLFFLKISWSQRYLNFLFLRQNVRVNAEMQRFSAQNSHNTEYMTENRVSVLFREISVETILCHQVRALDYKLRKSSSTKGRK